MQGQWSQPHHGGSQYQPGGPVGGERPGTGVPTNNLVHAPLGSGPRQLHATTNHTSSHQQDAREDSQRPPSMESLHAKYLREYNKGLSPATEENAKVRQKQHFTLLDCLINTHTYLIT